MHKLLENYINKITIDDVLKFAEKNGAHLSGEELNLIYKYVKNDWETIIFGNPSHIFEILKQNLSKENYKIAHSLFVSYKEKFQNYL
jgi:hypothetical protein